MGRPAKHLYGLNRVSRSLALRPNLNLLSRDAIQRRVPVQKLCAAKPPLDCAERMFGQRVAAFSIPEAPALAINEGCPARMAKRAFLD